MKKYPIAAFAALLAAAPGSATTLLSVPLNTPINTTKTTPIQTKDWAPADLTVHCDFVYGSGGDTVDAYFQVSVDGGSTWVDVAECHFTTASLRELYDITSLPSALSSRIATDGSLTSNAANGRMIGWRVEYVSTGTYSDGTTLQIDLQGGRSRAETESDRTGQ